MVVNKIFCKIKEVNNIINNISNIDAANMTDDQKELIKK
jgi:hypothetical protein